MSDYKVVMIVRKSNSVELLEELKDIDFDAMGVKIEVLEDNLFDSYVAIGESHEG